jgi:hypothetical protein
MTTTKDAEKADYIRPRGEVGWQRLEPVSLTSTRGTVYRQLTAAGFDVEAFGCVGFDEPRWRKVGDSETTTFVSARKSCIRVAARRRGEVGLVAADAFWWSPQQVGGVYALLTFAGWPTRVGGVRELQAAVKALTVVPSAT